MQYFNIQIASQLSGVASATIRAWEKRYTAVVPTRADNGHRLYSEVDIEKLSVLFKLTEMGQTIGRIAHLPLEELKNVYSTISDKSDDQKGFFVQKSSPTDYEKTLTGLYIALAAYKIDIISHELEKAKVTLTPRDLTLNILVPLFHEIGNKVYNGELSIAQEHTLSAIVSFHLGQMIGTHYTRVLKKEFLVLITTPEGEMHEIGILASALLCVQHGIKFIFLGTNMPAASLAEAANALNCNAILMGVTKGHELDGHATLQEYLGELKANLKNEKKIWLGGNLKPYVRTELEKQGILYFSNLHTFDEYIAKI